MFKASRIVLTAIVLVAIGASLYISRQVYVHQQSLKEGARYNVAWSASQAISEYTRLQLAVAMAARDGARDDAILRYDIFINRLQLMSSGDFSAFLQTNAQHVTALRRIEGIVAELRPMLDHLDQPGVMDKALRLMAPATPGLVALAAAANRHGGERVAADEAYLLDSYWMFSALAAALILSGIALILMLARRMAELRAARESLEDTATRLTGALAAADSASRAKAAFLATMSHEIRTPLNAMLGLTSSLLDDIKTGPQRRLLETIRDAGDGLLRLVNDILDFSKLDAGRMTLEDAAFSPEALTRNVAGILEPHAKAKSISLFVLMGPDVPPAVLGDPGRIEQILINLTSNAVKFTETGHVTVQLAREKAGADDASLVWRISDTGIGIPADRVDTLFNEFVQADNTITRRFGGTGLGLAICKRLVDQMGGTIAVESTAGVGSSFFVRLTLPLAQENAAEPADTHGPADVVERFDALTRSMGRKARILFVEDNPTNQFVATQLLKGFDVHLDMAGNGLEALDSVSRFDHDLICMDVRMPEMDGLEATRQIRLMGGRMATIPIIALTANAFKEDVDACLAAGMNRFVSKPVRREILLGAMLAELSGLLGAGPGAAGMPLAPPPPDPAETAPPPAYDATEFDDLVDMLGEEGVAEMIDIFEVETRGRVRRVAAGDQDLATTMREMHTLKGAAGTVACPRLAAMGRILELAAKDGRGPTAGELHDIEAALEEFLASVRARHMGRAA